MSFFHIFSNATITNFLNQYYAHSNENVVARISMDCDRLWKLMMGFIPQEYPVHISPRPYKICPLLACVSSAEHLNEARTVRIEL